MKNIFAVNKPKGIKSHEVVVKVRKISGAKRVGHGGTLDPLASGVLVIAVGRENTILLDQYVKGEKEYVANIKLGYESTTDDEEGPIRRVAPQGKEKKTSLEEIEKILIQFIGKIKQTPPLYSAIKIEGKEAYKYARRGKIVELKPRTVEIKQIEMLSYNYPILQIRVSTGPGVYIRSLARDIGKKLKTGAYLADLERTRVGEFLLDKSINFDHLEEYFKA